MLLIYNLFLFLYIKAIRLTSIWNEKALLWVEGRKDIQNKIKSACESGHGPIVWMHCASLGEFEQGRALLERIKKQYPSYRILLTFFSPSGYVVRKKYNHADMIFYLPMDGKKNARLFLDTVNPKMALFIKYESWYYYLKELKNRNIPTLLVSAKFTRDLSFFGIFGSFLRGMLEEYTHIFLQDENSLTLLKEFHVINKMSISGDTRFDRVLEIAETKFNHPVFESFCSHGNVLVAGSTWTEDEEILADLLSKEHTLKMVIAPHEISDSHIEKIKNLFPNSILFSNINETNHFIDKKVLIVDTIGMLSKIYRYATICYVGGGFNKSGIHNIIEAAVYGKVVCFGKYFGFSREAVDLVKLGAAYSFENAPSFSIAAITLLGNELELKEKNEIARNYVIENIGATNKIMSYIERNLLLSNSIN